MCLPKNGNYYPGPGRSCRLAAYANIIHSATSFRLSVSLADWVLSRATDATCRRRESGLKNKKKQRTTTTSLRHYDRYYLLHLFEQII